MTDDKLPEWVKTALEIDGLAMDEPCTSCGQDDVCHHPVVEIRRNTSEVCASCDRLLNGRPLKGDPERCAECGRKWVKCQK